MTIERFILIAIAVMSVSSFIYIPKENIRKALVSFLAFHATTWLVSIILVQGGKALYPVREFVRATSVNFIPQFIFYPTLFMWFILLFPRKRGVLIKIVHYIIFVSLMKGFIYFTFKYTQLYEVLIGSDFSMIVNGFLRNFFQYAICHIFVIWFFKKEIST